MTDSNNKVWFIRHAQSEYNKERLFTGWHDPTLTEKGIESAHELRKQLSNINFKYAYSSTLKRASKTAEIILKDKNQIIFDERLKERSYGDWSGLGKQDIKTQVGEEVFFSARRGWSTKPPNGESLEDVGKRVKSFLDELPKDGNVIVISHGNTIRAISVLLGVNSPETVSNYEIKVGTFLVV